ncbi:tetratricopeptide repeat protein [Catellatospora sichuanensis]|uniref:tetratricopeptide repeat protein n=1 Tax=Catellatospora sichuanensis TaxID=1969805 RepID=UPI001182E91C|nr:tetratricopeptide repeat protein [Catellatospora sichuanensis]
MNGDERLISASESYENAVFGGDTTATETGHHDLDSLEADLALARGRLLHADFLHRREEDPAELPAFERAAELYARLGDAHGQSQALFWLGCFHQVVRDDADTARPLLQRSYDIARQTGDALTLSYAVRHLGFADLEAGDAEAGREKLEESARLRRELGFLPGLAAAQLALAQLAFEQGRDDEAAALLAEAREAAARSRAHGVLAWIDAARVRI